MLIKNQGFSIVSADFAFYVDGDFEVQIALDQPCFANCTLVVSGTVEVDEGLFPCVVEYAIESANGRLKIVELNPALEQKIESEIDDLFYKDYESYCEKMRDEIACNGYEG